MFGGLHGDRQIKGAIHRELVAQVEGLELGGGNLERGAIHPVTVDAHDVGDSELAQFPEPFGSARSKIDGTPGSDQADDFRQDLGRGRGGAA